MGVGRRRMVIEEVADVAVVRLVQILRAERQHRILERDAGIVRGWRLTMSE